MKEASHVVLSSIAVFYKVLAIEATFNQMTKHSGQPSDFNSSKPILPRSAVKANYNANGNPLIGNHIQHQAKTRTLDPESTDYSGAPHAQGDTKCFQSINTGSGFEKRGKEEAVQPAVLETLSPFCHIHD